MGRMVELMTQLYAWITALIQQEPVYELAHKQIKITRVQIDEVIQNDEV